MCIGIFEYNWDIGLVEVDISVNSKRAGQCQLPGIRLTCSRLSVESRRASTLWTTVQ